MGRMGGLADDGKRNAVEMDVDLRCFSERRSKKGRGSGGGRVKNRPGGDLADDGKRNGVYGVEMDVDVRCFSERR